MSVLPAEGIATVDNVSADMAKRGTAGARPAYESVTTLRRDQRFTCFERRKSVTQTYRGLAPAVARPVSPLRSVGGRRPPRAGGSRALCRRARARRPAAGR